MDSNPNRDSALCLLVSTFTIFVLRSIITKNYFRVSTVTPNINRYFSYVSVLTEVKYPFEREI